MKTIALVVASAALAGVGPIRETQDALTTCAQFANLSGDCPPASTATTRDDSVDVRATVPGSLMSERNSGSPNAGASRGVNAGTGRNGAGETIQRGQRDPNADDPLSPLPEGIEYIGRESGSIPAHGFVFIQLTIESVIETVTIDDLVNFRPAAATLRMEPDGWTVVGLETNFFIDVTTNTQNGELLGRAAAVRFTPVGYRFNYGDSTTVNRTTAGGTWTTQSLDEFDPTPTSHIFTDPGSFTVTAAIEYTAQYQFDGGPWMPVVGTVRTPTNVLDVIAARSTTVLVNNTCLSAPAGPGC